MGGGFRFFDVFRRGVVYVVVGRYGVVDVAADVGLKPEINCFHEDLPYG